LKKSYPISGFIDNDNSKLGKNIVDNIQVFSYEIIDVVKKSIDSLKWYTQN